MSTPRQLHHRVRAALGEPATRAPVDRLAEALSHGPMSRLFVRQGPAIIPVTVADVSWFEADGDYVIAHAGRTLHVMHVSLNRLEARLDPERFSRIHRRHVVNLDHVTGFRPSERGRFCGRASRRRLWCRSAGHGWGSSNREVPEAKNVVLKMIANRLVGARCPTQ